MSNQQEKNNIPKHQILIFFLLVIGITASGYVLYENQKAEFKKREYNNLSSIANLKVREISNWRKERLGDAHIVQQNLPAIHRIRQLLENPSSVEIRQELLSWMESLRESNQYGSVVLLDTKKQVRLYWGDETRLVGSHIAAPAEEAMRTKRIVFSDFRWGEVKYVIRLDIFVPLLATHRGHENIPVGVLLLRSDPRQTLYPIVQFWPTSSSTAETLLVRREGDEVVFLNELRHKKDTALTLRMPISEKQLPAAMAARGEEGIVEGIDYRGVPVLAAIKAVPDTPWYIIVKIDTGEVYAPLRERFSIVLILVCTLIVLAGTAIGLIWRHQRAQFYRKQYEAELEREALTRHYEYLTKYANDIILMMDAGWNIVEANERAVQAYGCTRDELLQMNIREVYDSEVIPYLSGWMEQVDMGNGLVYETVHRRKDGTTFPVEISARTMVVEGKKFYQAIIRDITARKRSEEVLQISEARYRRFFESARDGILILDANTEQVIDANPFMQDLLGYSFEEFVGKRLWDIGAFKDIAASKISFDELQRKGYIRYEDLPLETNDGRNINVEFTSNIYMVDSKRVIQCNIRDITARKQAEETLNEEIRSMTQQLWQAAKLATGGELLASIAHELNNPLATVSLRVESLLEKTPENSPDRRELDIIEQEIERMSNLIANLLQFSRRGQLQISTVDVCEEIEKTLELIYYHLRQHNIIIQQEFAKDVPNIHADRQQLRQLLLNLFTNAGDAMPQGGTLTIRVIAPPEARQIIIEVADTGTGIPPEVLPKVAEPFYTTKPEGKGTGLGLAICRRIALEHQGTFDLTSEGVPGRGTTVRISLPAKNETNAAELK